LRASGGRIWIDPLIRAVYFSRISLSTLAKQYFAYGFWKYKMLRLYPKTLRWRQALPPVFVLGILMLLLLAGFSFLARLIFLIGFGLYTLILFTASIQTALKRADGKLITGIPLAIMTMHFSWGSGFWWSLLNPDKEGI
jgi:succinoglycan biosynthesis protein ExoA